ncbi:MAG: NADH-quinone oxidoreductase subunit NuoK [Myxococcota bacterium]
MTPLTAFTLLAAALFAMGLYAVLARRNLIAMLIGIELMLNAASLNALAFGRYGALVDVDPALAAVSGQLLALFIIGLAAAEAAIALAIILAVHRHRQSVDVDALDTLQG